MAKKVGSNFFLKDRRLSADLDFAFMALATGGGVASAPPCESAISKIVNLRLILSNSMIDELVQTLKDWKIVFQQYPLNLIYTV
jgi:hypothetical protein